MLGDHTEIIPVPIPLDCTDGFGEAFYGRPEYLLDPGARRACSAWSFVDPPVEARFVEQLSVATSQTANGIPNTVIGASRLISRAR
jgi:hypothetical protein